MRELIFALALSLILFIGTAQATNIYSLDDWYLTNNGTDAQALKYHNYLPSLYSPDIINCTAYTELFATIDHFYGPYHITTYYYAPYDTPAGLSTRDVDIAATDWACQSMGTLESTDFEIIGSNNIYERKAITTDLWDNGWVYANSFTTLRGQYDCYTDSNWLNFSSDIQDSDGYYVNTFYSRAHGTCVACDVYDADIMINTTFIDHYPLNESYYSQCETFDYAGNHLLFIGASQWDYDFGTGTPVSHPFTAMNYLVFNSSSLGVVKFRIYEPNATIHNNSASFYTGVIADVYPLDNSSNLINILNINLTNNDDEFYTEDNPVDVELTLVPDTTYVFRLMESVYATATHNWYEYTNSNFTVSIFVARPDWICGDWSACSNNTKWRECEDANDVVIDKIEHRACYTAPKEELWLGFDDNVDPVEVWTTFLEWTCVCSVEKKTVNYPTNWEVMNPLLNYTDYGSPPANTSAYQWDFIKVTDETSADGDSRSLKMWYIPPKMYMPLTYAPSDGDVSIICGNQTHGGYPILSRWVNETIFIEKNVTFTSPYMTLFLNVKKCKKPEFQYPAPNIFGWQYCGPDACYTQSGNCTEEPRGRLYVRMFDAANVNLTIFENIGEITEANLWESREYRIDQLETDHNYTLRFGILPAMGNNLDPDSYCLYLDNVSFYIRDEEIECGDYCDSNIYGLLHDATDISGACVYRDTHLSPSCVSSEIVEDILNQSDFCDPNCENASYRYYNFDITTETWSIIENSDYCEDWCEEQAEQREITDVLTSEGILHMFSFFASPLFISIIISIGAGAFVGAKTKIMPIGLVTIMLFLMGFTILGFFPIWLFIVLIVIAGFMMARGTLGTLGGK